MAYFISLSYPKIPEKKYLLLETIINDILYYTFLTHVASFKLTN